MIARAAACRGWSVVKQSGIEWESDLVFRLGRFRFRILADLKLPKDHPPDLCLLLKEREILADYAQMLGDHRVSNMVELGIFHGGSALFFHEWLEPAKLVAIDHDEPFAPYLRLVEEQGLAARIRNYFGTDQADRQRLQEIVTAEFGGEPLDLVIDDASHYYEETTASFEVLFPRLRAGGWYVIEDWAWAHTRWTEIPAWAEKAALTNLVARLVTLLAQRQEHIAEMWISARLCAIRRGGAVLDSPFELERHLDARALRLNLI